MIVLGIDLGIRKLAVACLDLSTELGLVDATAYEAKAMDPDKVTSRARVLHELGSWLYDYALETNVDHIFVEQVIIGNNRKYSLELAQTLGAVLSALHVVSFQTGARIHLVDNKAWKKRMLGNGNTDKEAIRTYIDTAHSAYALLCDGDQDRYDACCIGLYGLDILAGSEGLKLVGELPGPN